MKTGQMLKAVQLNKRVKMLEKEQNQEIYENHYRIIMKHFFPHIKYLSHNLNNFHSLKIVQITFY